MSNALFYQTFLRQLASLPPAGSGIPIVPLAESRNDVIDDYTRDAATAPAQSSDEPLNERGMHQLLGDESYAKRNLGAHPNERVAVVEEVPVDGAGGAMKFQGQPPAPAAPQKDDLAARYKAAGKPVRQARKAEEKAVDTAVQAEINKNALYEPLKKERAEADRVFQESTQEVIEARANLVGRMERLQALSNELAATPIRDRWAEANMPVKIGALIAMGLGSALQEFTGDKTNVVAEQINNAIERDLGMQKLRLEKGKDDIARSRLLLADTGRMWEDKEDSLVAAHSAALQSVQARIDALSKQSTNPQIVAQGMKLKAALGLSNAQNEQHLVEQGLGHIAHLQQINAQAKAHAEADPMKQLLTERRLAIQEANLVERQKDGARQENELTLEGWEGQGKSAIEMRKLRSSDEKLRTMKPVFDEAKAILAEGSLLTRPGNIVKIQQLGSMLESLGKQADTYDFGAALSGGELTRLTRAIGTSNWAFLNSKLGQQLLDRAYGLLESMHLNKIREQGLSPPAKK